MKILILNPILCTHHNNIIPVRNSIKDTMIYTLARGFKSLGHEVTLVAADDYRPTAAEEYECEVLFFTSRFKRLFQPAVLPFSPDTFRWLRRNHQRYDLIIASETFSFPSLFAAICAPKRTIIWQELDLHQRKFRKIPSKLWYNIIARCIMSRVNCVVPRSLSAGRFISRYMPRVTDEIVEHGVDVDKFRFADRKGRYLISTAQLIPRKNVDKIIEVFNRLHKLEGYRDVQLVIAGTGVEEQNLRRMVADLSLDDVVTFAGFLPHAQLNELIRRALASLIYTSHDLNMLSIPETIVSGTPFVSTHVPLCAVHYADTYRVGVARDDWDESAIIEVIDNNAEYMEHCKLLRDELSHITSARRLIALFQR